jgi:hypothetical protein
MACSPARGPAESSRSRGEQAPRCLLGAIAAVACRRRRPRARPPFTTAPAELWRDVEVIRTAHGVPHSRRQPSAPAATRWRGCSAKTTAPGRRCGCSRRAGFPPGARTSAVDANFEALRDRARRRDVSPPRTRNARHSDGFAAGVNRYVELHAEEFPRECRRTSRATTSPRFTSGMGLRRRVCGGCGGAEWRHAHGK